MYQYIKNVITSICLHSKGKIIQHKWESCMTVDKRSWTHRRQIQIEDVLTIEELLAEIAETVR